MSASFHPSDELLVAYGAGSLDEATALLVATHLALCPCCRDVVEKVEFMGGVMLDDLPPSDLAADALASVLNRLESPAPRRKAAPVPPALAAFPAPLRTYLGSGLDGLPWQKLSAGMEQAVLLDTGVARARLFRIAEGVAIPEHGHEGMELSLVLQGAFSDHAGHYRRGDVASADGETVHRPVVEGGETCLCLTVTDAPLYLTGLLGRLMNPFLKL